MEVTTLAIVHDSFLALFSQARDDSNQY